MYKPSNKRGQKMKALDRLNEFPKKFKVVASASAFNMSYMEPSLKCFVHFEDNWCVIKGFYEEEQRNIYTIHHIITRPAGRFLGVGLGAEMVWSEEIDWWYSLDSCIDEMRKKKASADHAIWRAKEQKTNFFKECVGR